MKGSRANILIPCKHFPPAYISGGPVRALENVIPDLACRFDITVLTTDRDLGDVPLDGVVSDAWEERLGARVYRLSRKEENWRSVARFIRDNSHDVLYLNSLFSPLFTGAILTMRKAQIIPWRPIVLAPRGELNPGALEKKKSKKKLFLSVTRELSLYKDIVWQATSIDESHRVADWFPQAIGENRILLAEDLARRLDSEKANFSPEKIAGTLRLAFVSRINRMKGFDTVLEAISGLEGDIELNVYGTRDADAAYLRFCDDRIAALPSNVKAKEHGQAFPEDVPGIFARHDVFFLPTHGENYGHVIPESLGAGCPVLISDKTPWQDLEKYHAGWVVRDQSIERYREILRRLVKMEEAEHRTWREEALAYARRIDQRRGEVVERSYGLFERAMELYR